MTILEAPSLTDQATEIVAASELLLLDFEGTLCGIENSPTATQAAAHLLTLLPGQAPMPEAEPATGPFGVLRSSHRHPLASRVLIDSACRRWERSVVTDCPLATGARALLLWSARCGIPVALVGQSASTTMEMFVEAHGLGSLVSIIAGRPIADPEKLAPSPYTIEQVLAAHTSRPAVLVAGSAHQVLAGTRAGLPTIGIADHDRERSWLVARGAAAAAPSLRALVERLSVA